MFKRIRQWIRDLLPVTCDDCGREIKDGDSWSCVNGKWGPIYFYCCSCGAKRRRGRVTGVTEKELDSIRAHFDKLKEDRQHLTEQEGEELIKSLERARDEHVKLTGGYGGPGMVMIENHGYIASGELFLDDYLYCELSHTFRRELAWRKARNPRLNLSSVIGKAITSFMGMKINKLKPGWEKQPLPCSFIGVDRS